MGNTGSIQNLHTEGVSNLNSYYRVPRDRGSRLAGTHKFHQGLKESSILRRNGEANTATINDSWSNSFPRPKHLASSTESPAPHVKVLPKLNDNLQLRSTANGAILQSGGTITGRREKNMSPVVLRKSLLLPPFGLMQRSHTLIYDRTEQQQDMFRSSTNNQLPAAPVFRRVHTQLNMKYNHSEKKSDPMLSAPDLRLDHNVTASHKLSSPIQAPKQENVGSTNKVTKVNKYNKKRKAPAVPSTAGTASNELKSKHMSSASAYRADMDKNNANSSSKNQMATNLAASSALAHEAKARLFRTKAESELSNVAGQRGKLALSACSPKPQKPQMPQAHRAAELCTSMKKESSVSLQQRHPLLPYRREKSFDATLLRGRELEASQQQNSAKQATTLQRLPTTDAPKATKIPQLKRTFYFGMETRRSSGSELVKKPVNDMQNAQQAESARDGKKVASTSTAKAVSSEKTQTFREDNNELTSAGRNQEEDSNASSSLSLTPVYDIGTSSKIYVDDSDDNGLQVLVRPTLPKRQLDIPRFSPAAAWRYLTERQQQVQLQRRGSTKVRRTTQTQSATAVGVSQKTPVSCTINDKNDAMNTTIDNSDKMPQKEAPIQPICSVTPLLLNTKLPQVAPGEAHVIRDQLKESTTKTCLATWTPQQDLEEDDSSSDELQLMQSKLKGGIEDRTFMFGANGESNAKASFPQNGFGCAAVHVFSLSLPREGNDMKTATAFNDKLQKSGFSSLQKLKQTVSGSNCGCIQSIYNDSNMMDHIFSSGTVTDHPLTTANVATDATNTDMTNGIQGPTYRNDNWVLGKTKLGLTSKQTIFGAAGNEDLQPASGLASDKARWNSLASMEPISLSHLTAGKHVMYLPHESSEQVTVNNPKPKIEQKSHEKQHKKRELHTRESLQDVTPAASPPTSSTTVIVRKQNRDAASTAIVNLLEKPQRFSFQSTVRLIEKRRLADKLSKDAEVKEAQRRSELEAMKRVEEDFQRKRAFEKASIRQQLRLVSSMETMEQYHSLPAVVDMNYRADPDGAVSSPSSSPLMHAVKDTERFVLGKTTDDVCNSRTPSQQVASRSNNHIDKDRERQRVQSLYRERDSSTDLDIDILEFQRTASLVEPYLQSIVK